MHTTLVPFGWVDAVTLDHRLSVLRPSNKPITIVISAGSKLMVDSAVRLLCACDQWAAAGQTVLLKFVDGYDGTMSYLDRLGFFDHLPDTVETIPQRPGVTRSEIYRGTNTNLVEIIAFHPNDRDITVPTAFADAVETWFDHSFVGKRIGKDVFSLFGELIGNIEQHSGSTLPAYGALQLYDAGSKAKLTVADSGNGLVKTVRPVLNTEAPHLVHASDADVVEAVFQQGISRTLQKGRGLGLSQSATRVVRYQSIIAVHIDSGTVTMRAHQDGLALTRRNQTDVCTTGIAGTQICFDLNLDSILAI